MILTARTILLLYAILLIIGALMGYQKGSLVSLGAGIISGAIGLFAVYLIGRNPTAGLTLGLAVALVVGLAMLIRFLKTQAFMPAGLVLILSIIAITTVTMGLGGIRR